jgi:hypothetical protein
MPPLDKKTIELEPEPVEVIIGAPAIEVELGGGSPPPEPQPRDAIIAIVLDKSGSMTGLKAAVIESFNAFIADQAALDADTFVVFSTFALTTQIELSGVPARDVVPLTSASYQPSGGTALYDAIDDTITRVESVLAEHPGVEVIFAVITDGDENASRRVTKTDMVRRIQDKTDEHWNFVYLSADLDAFSDGAAIGLATAGVGSWTPTYRDYTTTIQNLSGSVISYRGSSMATGSYTLTGSGINTADSVIFNPETLIKPDEDKDKS